MSCMTLLEDVMSLISSFPVSSIQHCSVLDNKIAVLLNVVDCDNTSVNLVSLLTHCVRFSSFQSGPARIKIPDNLRSVVSIVSCLHL